LISVAADGTAADGESESPSMSADGRYVAFVSFADNLVAGGASGYGDIFLRDTCAGAPAGCVPATTLISVAAGGAFANGESESPSISASGRYVVFSSLATNLVMGTTTTSAEPEIYLRDLCVGAAAGCQASTIQLSVSSATSSLTSSSTSGTPTSNP
jgi:Tol biopolymer transport system component